MGIIDGVKRAVTTAAENIKKATQAKAKEAQERRQSSGAKDKAEISSQAQEVGSKGSKVADLQDEKKVDPRTSKKPLELSGEQLSDCSEETQELATEMVAEGVCEPEELIILQAPQKQEDNNIQIRPGEDGGLRVSINGNQFEYSKEEAERLIIAGGDRGNTIEVDDKVTQGVNIAAGRGADKIKGSNQADRIYAGGGDNEVEARGGNDKIVAKNGDNLIDGGDGSDTIEVGNGDNEIYGQAGHDKITTGDGRNYVDAGSGNDTIRTGDGKDTIYGRDGHDTIYGGGEQDYIDGGLGNDRIYGQDGDDILMGGKGNDTISGGKGSDVIAGGYGRDTVSGDEGQDKITVATSRANRDTVRGLEEGENLEEVEPLAIPENIVFNNKSHVEDDDYMKGTQYPDFQGRVQDDLDSIASLAYGRDLLQALGETDRPVRLGEELRPNGLCAWSPEFSLDGLIDWVFTRSSKAEVYYNPSHDEIYGSKHEWSETPPVVILLHELCHAYNATKGNIAKDTHIKETYVNERGTIYEDYTDGAEYQAVGLEIEGVESNPEYATENGWRRYFNIPERLAYTDMEKAEAKIVPEEEVPKN